MNTQAAVKIKPALGMTIWLGFAIAFFYSGLFFTQWVLGDESFAGGWRWIMVATFPFLVPGFFLVNRHYGCASGSCKASTKNSAPPLPLA